MRAHVRQNASSRPAAAARDYAVLTRRRALMEFGRTTSSPDGLSISWTGFPMGAVATRWSIARQAPSPVRTGAGQTVLPTNTTTPRMSTSLLASTVRSEQRPLSVSEVRRPSRSTRRLTTVSPPRPGIAHRDQATVGRGLVGVDPDVITHPHTQ